MVRDLRVDPRQRPVPTADTDVSEAELGNGEVIQIQETGQPGGLAAPPADGSGIRHFQVGKGDAIVRAMDASGNSASAACR